MITIKVKRAAWIGDKIRGVIGRNHMQPFFIQTIFGIHTFGVARPIDVIILDRDNRIRILKKSLSPNRVFFWNPRFDGVLEMPQNSITSLKLRVGDIVNLQSL